MTNISSGLTIKPYSSSTEKSQVGEEEGGERQVEQNGRRGEAMLMIEGGRRRWRRRRI